MIVKKILLAVAVICLYNCGVQKKAVAEQLKIERLIDSLDYKVILPSTWNPILDSHKNLSYSPINLGDIFYKNIIYIYDQNIVDENNILKDFVIKNIETSNVNTDFENIDLTPINTKYGETYIVKREQNWNFTHYIKTTFYFKQKNKFFKFHYSSDERFYEKYIGDVDFIFSSLVFND